MWSPAAGNRRRFPQEQKGRAFAGWIYGNLLKPAGMTSHDAVSALRRILRTKKTGHTGTLDPMAAGVLPVCIGKAT